MSTKANPSRFDCYDKLPDNEPYFCLRASDSEAADLVELWAIRARANQVHVDKVREAFDLAEEMRRWPKRKVAD